MGADPPEISRCYEQKCLLEAYARRKKGVENTPKKSRMGKGLYIVQYNVGCSQTRDPKPSYRYRIFFFFLRTSSARGGGGGRCQTFSFSFFPCSADHERDWPPCKVVFFGLATNALNVRNNNNNNRKHDLMSATMPRLIATRR